MFLSSYDELNEFCTRMRGARVLAVDTEFLRERTYHPKLCLIQVATHDEVAAIDALSIEDLSPLQELFEDDAITKVFHACDQDLEVILDHMGCVPRPLFDTQLAASFLGYRMQMGYGALVQAYEGVHLNKADGLTDWSKRPLDAEQLQYAEEDVIYLPRIYDRMMDALVRKGRLAWMDPELEAIVESVLERRDPQNSYLHLKRSASLTRKQLSVAREVCAWREEAASRRDIPKKWVMKDEIVVEICRRMPRTPERLRRIRGLDGISNRDAAQIVEAVTRGVEQDPMRYPNIRHKPRTNADLDSVLDLMYSMLRVLADRCGVAVPLIATRQDLASFATGNEHSSLSDGWRYEVAGRHLEGLLSGEVGLTVKDGRIEML
ncbi:MAG: ribonuclease D [Coriobacteriales bacterium]|nr:ribonuclease D [Coriobacteriales bacterium]